MRYVLLALLLSGCQSAAAPAGAAPDSGAQCAAQPRGEPLSAADGVWTWIDFPEARCRDGSPTGIGVRLRASSDRLVIYLEGGGACFHDASCAINTTFASFNAAAFSSWQSSGGTSGLFDTSRADNPFRDWTAIYVPYCTGDVHAGNATDVDVPGQGAPKHQQFVGWANIGRYLERIVPTFAPRLTRVVLTGISAGGVGAAFNYDRVAQAFCPVPVTLLDDSGPILDDNYIAPCLQKRWRELWNLDATIPAGCHACREQPDGGGMVRYVDYLTQKYPDHQLALISAEQDSVMSLFFGFGTHDCAGLSGPSAGMTGAEFQTGILALRDQHLIVPEWGSYLVPSASHTWLTGLTLYSTTVDGVALTEWVDQVVNHQHTSAVSP
jgi:hypothetical protein